MGIYNLKEIIDGYKAGDLDSKLEHFNQNDLVFLIRELENYLKKNSLLEDNKALLGRLREVMNSLE